MEENKWNSNTEPMEDDFMDTQYAPIEISDVPVKQSAQTDHFVPHTSKADIMSKCVIVMAALLVVDMFLPYVSIYLMDSLIKKFSLFPGGFAFGFMILAALVVVFMFIRKEKFMIIAGLLNIGLLIRACSKASYADFAVAMSAQSMFTVKLEIGFYGMIICSVGLALAVLGFILSTDIKGNVKVF